MKETSGVGWRLWLGLSLGTLWMLIAILAALVGIRPKTVIVVFASLALLELMAFILLSTLLKLSHSRL